MNRRTALTLIAAAPLARARTTDPMIETHVHLFSDDLTKFPPHPNGSRIQPAPLEKYIAHAKANNIRHAVHVSAEPYQDDLRYLEYTLTHAPDGFLKGIALLDTTKPDTPARLEALAKKYPNKMVGLRIHCTRAQNVPPSTEGPIRDRDLMHPQAKQVWRKASDLDLIIQPHIMPWFAPQIGQLAKEFPKVRIIVDHFGHAGTGWAVRKGDKWEMTKGIHGYRNPAEFEQVAALAKQPNIVLKVSGLQYSSTQPAPYRDVAPLLRRAYEAFGPERLLWGSLGSSQESFDAGDAIFHEHLSFLKPAERAMVRYSNARRFFRFG